MVVGKMTDAELTETLEERYADRLRETTLAVSAKDSPSCSQRIGGKRSVFDEQIKDGVEWDEVLNACFEWGPRIYGVTLASGGTVHISPPRLA